MWRNDIEETEEDDFILTLGSISSGDRHLLTVLLTTSSNMKWTKLVFKKQNKLISYLEILHSRTPTLLRVIKVVSSENCGKQLLFHN